MILDKAVAQQIANDCGSLEKVAMEVWEKFFDIVWNKGLLGEEDFMNSDFGKRRVRPRQAKQGSSPQGWID